MSDTEIGDHAQPALLASGSPDTNLRDITALYQINRALLEMTSLADAMQRVADLLATTLRFDRVAIITVDRAARQITGFYAGGTGKGNVVEVTYDELWTGLSGWVLRERLPAISLKGQLDPRESPAAQRRRLETNCGAIIVIPILDAQGVLGTITAINRPEQRDFDQADVNLLVSLSSQIAVTMANNRLYQSLVNEVKVRGQAEQALRQSAAELQQSELRFRQLAEHIQEVFWLYDAGSQRLTYISPAYESIWGRLREDAYQNPHLIAECTLPEDLPLIVAARAREACGEQTDLEYRIVRPDGAIRWIWERSFPVLDQAGVVLRTVGVATDITERKRADHELRNRQRLLEQVIHLGKRVAAINDLPRCLQAIHHSVQAALGFDQVGLWLYDSASQQIRGAYGTVRSGELADTSAQTIEVTPGSVWQAALQSPSGTHWIENVQAGDTSPIGGELDPLTQTLVLTAWAGEAPIALITIDNRVSGRPISQSELEALQLFVGYAGLAIENARLNSGLEQRVRDRTAEVQDLYDHAPNGHHSLDANGVFNMINQTELRWLGYAREELVGCKKFSDLLSPDSQQDFPKQFAFFKAQGEVHGVELELVRKDGSIVPVLLNATAIYAADGTFLQSRTTIFDNTERRRVEQALRESETSLQSFLDTASDLIQRLDQHGRYLYVNRSWCETLGYTLEEALNMDMFEIIEPEYHEHCRTILRELTSSGRTQDFEIALRTKNGQSITVEGGVSAHRDAHGRVITNGIFRNITLRKQAELAVRQSRDELSAAYAALQKAARLKDEFLANMSHELRTPLNAILGLAESLSEQYSGPLNERQLISARRIDASGRHLLALINDILDLSKVEAGQLQLQRDRVAIRAVCEASLSFVRELAMKKSLRLDFEMDAQLAYLDADPRRLKQMLVNLLSNAVKFTPAGGMVQLEVRADQPAQGVRFVVHDTGIGIAPDNLARLFQPFMQLDSSLSREHEGTGLGLALVRNLAELHGGSVAVESDLGQGSRFTIMLPYADARASQAPAADAPASQLSAELLRTPVGEPALASPAKVLAMPPAPGPAQVATRILLVEDNENSLYVMVDYLETKHYQVVVARNGLEAIEQAEATRPDLILMDIQMPKMNGLEAICELRARPAFTDTPIIALTALAMPGDRERCLSAGANAYLTKPVSLKGLVDTISMLRKV